MADDGDVKVVTPGGKRSKSMVHRVDPGHIISGPELIVEQSEPRGMRPQTMSTAGMPENAFPAQPVQPMQAPIEVTPLPEPVGMRPMIAPDLSGLERALSPKAPRVRAGLVVTPGGYRDQSLVHQIDPGHKIDLSTGRLRIIHPLGHEVADYGVLEQRPSGTPLMPGNVAKHPDLVPSLGTGWIVYASWSNNTGHPVSKFISRWVVPPPPSSSDGQTIFLFNGIQNSTMIYQPVLQWGPSAAGGGNSWTVASWYADGQGGVAFHSNLVSVNPGDELIGLITQTGSQNDLFSYNCEFDGIANTGLPIANVQELTWCIETLEAYGLQKCSDYPDTNFTAFYGIDLETSAGAPGLTWAANDRITDCGQSARIVSNANPGGEVDLYYTTRVATAAVTGARNSDGRLETFIQASNGSVWNIWQTVPHAGPWSQVDELGGTVLQPVCSALNTDGRLEIFGIGTDNSAFNNWQTAAHSGPWSGWNCLGGWVKQLAIACNSDGRLELFGIGYDNALYNMWQTAPHSGPWSGWNRLGGIVKQISVALNSDGRLEAFAIGSDNALYHMWQTAPHSGPWSGWDYLGGWVSEVEATINSDGRLEVFGIGSDGAMYNIWQTAPHSGPWSGWNRLGGWVRQIVPACNSDGRLEVFGIGSDGALYNMWQTIPHSGPWSGWNRLGGWVSDVTASLNSDGRLEVFGVGGDADVYNMWQTAPHSGPWSGWNKLT